MIPKQVIEKAIEGGWNTEKAKYFYWQMTVCDPTFWQSLGKALGWEEKKQWGAEWHGNKGHIKVAFYNEPEYQAHEFYNLILTGGDTEKFWQELLPNPTKK